MAHWLLKTEPTVYSFAALLREGSARWDGITNPVALRHLRAAAVGDAVVIYHTGDERAAVGLAEITHAAYPDPGNPKLAVVDVKVGVPLKRPVPLAALKADPEFEDSPLVRQPRLSFVPLSAAQWNRLLDLAGT